MIVKLEPLPLIELYCVWRRKFYTYDVVAINGSVDSILRLPRKLVK